MPNFLSRTAIAICIPTLVVGCFERPGRPIVPCTRASVHIPLPAIIDKVDLLFVIDNSQSMLAEQRQVRDQIPRMIRALATGDSDANGQPDFPIPASLHVGFVTTNMGLGQTNIGGTCARNGDDGRLVGSRFYSFERGGNVESFAAEVTATISMISEQSANSATAGCGVERPLDAMLKAVAPTTAGVGTAIDYAPVAFLGSSGAAELGHGNTDNVGFLRDDSLLAVLVVSDEDDSSLDPTQPNYITSDGISPAVRVSIDSAAARVGPRPIEEIARSFISLRPQQNQLVYASIVGVPDGASTAQQALASPIFTPKVFVRMPSECQPRNACPASNETAGCPASLDCTDRRILTELAPVCTGPRVTGQPSQFALAAPGYRQVQLASALQERGVTVSVSTICSDNYQSALDEVVRKIGDNLRACLPRPLVVKSDGLVNCDVVELLPANVACASRGPGFNSLGSIVVGTGDRRQTRERCAIPQRSRTTQDEPNARGWYYEPLTGAEAQIACGAPSAQRVHFLGGSAGDVPASGSPVTIECAEVATRAQPGRAEVGSPCADDAACVGGANGLVCDSLFHQCTFACTENVECIRAGLTGFVCDTPRTRCVNPSCS